MEILETIKEIRELLGIPQSKMIPSMSGTTYSKIERGVVDLKFDVLTQICTTLGMTYEELILYSDKRNPSVFRKRLNNCLKNHDDEVMKKNLLNEFYPNPTKKIEELNFLELNNYCAIKTMLGDNWQELGRYTLEDISYIYKFLINKKYYTQADYQILMNTLLFMDKEQASSLISKVYPIQDISLRTDLLISYGHHALLNVISTAIYRLDYNYALHIINFTENLKSVKYDYYISLDIEYHKNVVFRFLKRDTEYIERAREIINSMRHIRDDETAFIFETELNNLTERADYYLNETIHRFPRTSIK